MKQAIVYTKGNEIVAVVPLGLEPQEGEFSTYYIGSGTSLAEAIGNAIMEWFGYSECRHSEVEIEESPGGDEYRESPGEFTPDLKFAVCKDCGEIV